jgi:pyridoxamine 5'-phosphate oxidase family protein
LVIDDIASREPWRVRCLEIRGTAEQVPAADGSAGGAIIRVHPQRIISFGLEDLDVAPHLLVPNSRNVG